MDYVKEKPFNPKNNGVDVQKLSSGKSYKVVSLFSGCGGLDLGFIGGFTAFNGKNQIYFEKNPYKIIWANDFHKEACESYKNYFDHDIICADITKYDKNSIPKGDIVIGGFPCQDFSISGKKKGVFTERGKLYKQLLEVVSSQKPIAFVAENVKNILSPKLLADNGEKVIDKIKREFEFLGYNIYTNLVYAPDYGVPQKRERVFIIGIHNSIKHDFIMPKSHHKFMTSKHAIDDLWGKENDLSILNHSQMSLAKFPERKKSGNQGNYKVHEDQPSQTIRSEHHMNIQAHYRTYCEKDPNNRSFWRRLTVRECGRLQTFPDDFWFAGTKSQAYKIVGNAVPPMLGWYIARALYVALSKDN